MVSFQVSPNISLTPYENTFNSVKKASSRVPFTLLISAIRSTVMCLWIRINPSSSFLCQYHLKACFNNCSLFLWANNLVTGSFSSFKTSRLHHSNMKRLISLTSILLKRRVYLLYLDTNYQFLLCLWRMRNIEFIFYWLIF